MNPIRSILALGLGAGLLWAGPARADIADDISTALAGVLGQIKDQTGTADCDTKGIELLGVTMQTPDDPIFKLRPESKLVRQWSDARKTAGDLNKVAGDWGTKVEALSREVNGLQWAVDNLPGLISEIEKTAPENRSATTQKDLAYYHQRLEQSTPRLPGAKAELANAQQQYAQACKAYGIAATTEAQLHAAGAQAAQKCP